MNLYQILFSVPVMFISICRLPCKTSPLCKFTLNWYLLNCIYHSFACSGTFLVSFVFCFGTVSSTHLHRLPLLLFPPFLPVVFFLLPRVLSHFFHFVICGAVFVHSLLHFNGNRLTFFPPFVFLFCPTRLNIHSRCLLFTPPLSPHTHTLLHCQNSSISFPLYFVRLSLILVSFWICLLIDCGVLSFRFVCVSYYHLLRSLVCCLYCSSEFSSSTLVSFSPSIALSLSPPPLIFTCLSACLFFSRCKRINIYVYEALSSEFRFI